MTDEDRLAAEQRARFLIDHQITGAGWVVQRKKDVNLIASQGMAVSEVIMAKGSGRAGCLRSVDQMLRSVDQMPGGVIEVKPQGTTLSGVEWQSARCADGLPADARLKAVTTEGRLSFVFEVSGSETHFTNGYDPNPRVRRTSALPQPAMLARTRRDAVADRALPTWRGKVAAMPVLDTNLLRQVQITAIGGIERSRAESASKIGQPRRRIVARQVPEMVAIVQSHRHMVSLDIVRLVEGVQRRHNSELATAVELGDLVEASTKRRKPKPGG